MKKKQLLLYTLPALLIISTLLGLYLINSIDRHRFQRAAHSFKIFKTHLQTLHHRYVKKLTEYTLSRMSQAEKLGQCFMIGWPTPTLTPELENFITRYHVGNLILLSRNYENPLQLQELNAQLQKTALRRPTPLPLWIGTDQEGGYILRLKKGGFTQFAGNMALAATGEPELATLQGQAIASELSAVGVNLNFAPSADTLTDPANQVIGTRAFSSDPRTVGLFSTAFMQGQQRGGVLSTLKHFPGHGGSSLDSHFELPVNEKPANLLWKEEINAFIAPLKSPLADFVMSAHIFYPGLGLTNQTSATFSSEVLDQLLRQKLGFQGLVISDDLEMAGASAQGGVIKAALKAFEAGCDILLISHTALFQKKALEKLLVELESSPLLKKRLEESAFRIVYKKIRQFGFSGRNLSFPAPDALKIIGQKSHQDLEKTIARKSITLVGKNPDFRLPRWSDPKKEVLLVLSPLHELGPLMKKYYPALDVIFIGFAPEPQKIQRILTQIKPKLRYYSKVILAMTSPEHAKIAHFLNKNQKQTVLLSLLNPYVLKDTPGELLLASYFYGKPSLEALFEVLFQDASPRGKLPVNWNTPETKTIPGPKDPKPTQK